VRCIYFFEENGLPACRLYKLRLPNCSKFPLDCRDLADRDLIAPDKPCGYSWNGQNRAWSGFCVHAKPLALPFVPELASLRRFY